MHRVRVLWLVKGLGLGGAERLLVEVAQRADHGRVDLHVAYVTPGKDALVDALTATGVTVHDLSDAPGGTIGRLVRAAVLVGRGGYDVVHAHSPLLAAVARLSAWGVRASRRPRMMTTEHNVWPQYRALSRLLNRWTYRWAGDVVAVSSAVRDSVPARWRDRVAVLHHGIDVDAVCRLAAERAGVRRELGLDDVTVVVGVVANLRPEKDVPLMLRAAARVVAARPDVRFVHVGGGSPLEAEVRDLHTRLGLGDRYRLLGARPDARRLLAGFDLVAFSSRHEGLPVVAMEAAALGLPIVATAAGGLPEIVAHERSGLVVPIGDEAALASAILRLARDADLRARMGQAASAIADAYDVGPAVAALQVRYLRADA